VKTVEGMRYGFADFEVAGEVVHIDVLPEDLWLKGDIDKFNWLNKRLPEEYVIMLQIPSKNFWICFINTSI
jgi:hypothetical protein